MLLQQSDYIILEKLVGSQGKRGNILYSDCLRETLRHFLNKGWLTSHSDITK